MMEKEEEEEEITIVKKKSKVLSKFLQDKGFVAGASPVGENVTHNLGTVVDNKLTFDSAVHELCLVFWDGISNTHKGIEGIEMTRTRSLNRHQQRETLVIVHSTNEIEYGRMILTDASEDRKGSLVLINWGVTISSIKHLIDNRKSLIFFQRRSIQVEVGAFIEDGSNSKRFRLLKYSNSEGGVVQCRVASSGAGKTIYKKYSVSLSWTTGHVERDYFQQHFSISDQLAPPGMRRDPVSQRDVGLLFRDTNFRNTVYVWHVRRRVNQQELYWAYNFFTKNFKEKHLFQLVANILSKEIESEQGTRFTQIYLDFLLRKNMHDYLLEYRCLNLISIEAREKLARCYAKRFPDVLTIVDSDAYRASLQFSRPLKIVSESFFDAICSMKIVKTPAVLLDEAFQQFRTISPPDARWEHAIQLFKNMKTGSTTCKNVRFLRLGDGTLLMNPSEFKEGEDLLPHLIRIACEFNKGKFDVASVLGSGSSSVVVPHVAERFPFVPPPNNDISNTIIVDPKAPFSQQLASVLGLEYLNSLVMDDGRTYMLSECASRFDYILELFPLEQWHPAYIWFVGPRINFGIRVRQEQCISAKNVLICEVAGVVIPSIYTTDSCAWKFGEQTVLETHRRGNMARFIKQPTESQFANCQAFFAENRIRIYSTRRIEAGEELRIN